MKMTIVRKMGSGYYVSNKLKRNIFLVKYHGNNPNDKRGYVELGTLMFPLELVGKRVRVRVEILED